MDRLMKCQNCRFWQSLRNEGQAALGECRRYAPKVYFETQRIGFFPAVKPDGWCGDWQIATKRLSKEKLQELLAPAVA